MFFVSFIFFQKSHGLQLWVNLKSSEKMVEPAYQELLDKDIPRKTEGGVTVKVIAGESLGVKVNILLTSSQK